MLWVRGHSSTVLGGSPYWFAFDVCASAVWNPRSSLVAAPVVIGCDDDLMLGALLMDLLIRTMLLLFSLITPCWGLQLVRLQSRLPQALMRSCVLCWGLDLQLASLLYVTGAMCVMRQ